MNKHSSIFRKSPFILLSRLFVLELLLAVAYGIVGTTISSLFDEQFLRLTSFIIFTIIEMAIVLWITLKWSGEFYSISNEDLVHQKGVFDTSEESFSLKNVQAVSLSQSFIGRMFNYGTVKFFSPVLKQEYYLAEISDPKLVKELIEHATGGFSGKVGDSHGIIIPIRNTK